MTNLYERLLRLREPRAWSPKDWEDRRSYDMTFDDCYRGARGILRENDVEYTMGLVNDGKSFGLMHRYLTGKILVDEERLTDSNSRKKDIAKVIASMDIDIQQYIGHFFPEDTQAARVIQLSLNYLYSLGTEGGARKECYLSYEQRKLWKSRYGALDTQEAAGSKTVNIKIDSNIMS
jgi:hypothetical protein